MRVACAITLMLCLGCGSATPPPVAALTPAQSAGTSAHAFLECIGRSGVDCVAPHPAGDAWVALGDLDLVETHPAPLVPAALFAAEKRLGRPDGYQALVRETLRGANRSRDLSCRITKVERVGAQLLARRDRLLRFAERMGLGSTRASARVGRLAAAVSPLRGSFLASARCNTGDMFVLVSPPAAAVAPDEDPRAHPGAGWRAYAASPDRARLLRGGSDIPPDIPVVRDPTRDGVDAWIPLTELDL